MTVIAMLGGASDAAQAHITAAFAVAHRMKAGLTGLLALPDPSNAMMYFSGPESVMAGSASIDVLIVAQDEVEKAMRSTFDQVAKATGHGVRAEFVRQTGSATKRGEAAALLADAFVLPREAAQSDHALNPVFDHVLMHARLPLVLADGGALSKGPCLIAWDASPQAARAVKLHLPLIRTYSHVVIAQHPGKMRQDNKAAAMTSPQALATWLQKEGLRTEIAEFSGKISDGLLQLADKHHAGLLVMGAYGHSRLGEMLFGGTSQALLNASSGPVLALSH